MGLSDFFKRRRERESAIPESVMRSGDISAQVGEAQSPTPTPTPSPTPPKRHASIADEVAAVTGGDLADQMQQLQSLMAEHSVDLRSQPMEVRQAIVDDLNAGGVPAKIGQGLNVTDPQQIQTVVEVLKKHGLLPPNVNVTSE
jgi:hypothetical protein